MLIERRKNMDDPTINNLKTSNKSNRIVLWTLYNCDSIIVTDITYLVDRHLSLVMN